MKTKFCKPKKMWAYIAIDHGSIHCHPSERKARGFWAEQGKSKRIRRVLIRVQKLSDAVKGKG